MKNRCNTEHYKVRLRKVPDFLPEELSNWFLVYCKSNKDLNEDQHQKYADILGVSREDAKSLAHDIAHFAVRGSELLGHGK